MPSTTTAPDLEAIAAQALADAQAFLDNSSRFKVEKNPKLAANVTPAEIVNPGPTGGAGYNVRQAVPSITEQDYTQRFTAIQGQLRAERVRQENLKLDRELAVSAGLQNEVELQNTKNLAIGEKAVTESVKLSQQQARSQLERVKLESLNLDISGERALLEPKQQLNQVRLEGARVDVNGSRALLEPQRQKWALQLEAAELKLTEIRGALQRQRAAIGTGTQTPIEIID